MSQRSSLIDWLGSDDDQEWLAWWLELDQLWRREIARAFDITPEMLGPPKELDQAAIEKYLEMFR